MSLNYLIKIEEGPDGNFTVERNVVDSEHATPREIQLCHEMGDAINRRMAQIQQPKDIGGN